jgi:predicted RNA-binding protein YlqC (UPF0109 family)
MTKECVSVESLVRNMIESIVDDVGAVSLSRTVSEKGVMLEVRVSKDDVGKIIGKQGRIANSIRNIAKASAAKNGERIMVNILNTSI